MQDWTYLFAVLMCSIFVSHNCYVQRSNYYDILGVSQYSSDKDIKKAFRKLALHYHPDKYKNADANDKFQQIVHAYEILSNPEKRNYYDKYGREPNPFGEGHERDPDLFTDIFNNFEDIFSENEDFFGSRSARNVLNSPELIFNMEEFIENVLNPGNEEHLINSRSCRLVTETSGNTVRIFTSCT